VEGEYCTVLSRILYCMCRVAGVGKRGSKGAEKGNDIDSNTSPTGMIKGNAEQLQNDT